MFEKLAKTVAEALDVLYSKKIANQFITIQETVDHFEGDFTVVIFPLLKISEKNPMMTGEQIGQYLLDHLPEVKFFDVVKGFLNLTMHDDYWTGFLSQANAVPLYGFSEPDVNAPPVLVEFSSPNTNKPLHLGHIRNNLIGDAVASLLKANGKNVVRINLVNDRGIHICKSMIGWMRFGKGSTPELKGCKGDKLVGDYYVAFDKAYKSELKELKDSGMDDREAEEASVLMEEARQLLRHWEEGEEQTRQLWQQMNQWVYEGFAVTYDRMGIAFDRTYYESETYLKGKELVLQGVRDGILEKRDDGSVWIDLRDEGMDEKLLLRADGTSVYMTQDLGNALIREEEYQPEKMIYVVGNEQNYHFDVLVRALKRMQFPFADKISHLSYGMVELPSGKMKSREGTVVDADDLMDEMFHTAREVTMNLGKWGEEALADLEPLFEMIGIGALKYYILKVDPKKSMLFNPEESIDFNGNTGPFIQYTHARIASLLRKGVDEGLIHEKSDSDDHGYPLMKEERTLLRILYRWPGTLKEAGETLSPALIANYCYELARRFNQFYHEHSVLGADELSVKEFRLVLSTLTGRTLRNAMGILGIKMPDQM